MARVKYRKATNKYEQNRTKVVHRGHVKICAGAIFIIVYLVHGLRYRSTVVFEKGIRPVVGRQWRPVINYKSKKEANNGQQEAATAASYGFALNMKYCYPRPKDAHTRTRVRARTRIHAF